MATISTSWEPTTPEALAKLLHPVRAHWYIAGGWALDLWHGRQTRSHEDLEFCVLRPDLAAFRTCLGGFDWYVAGGGAVNRLNKTKPAPNEGMQFWAQRRSTGRFAFDMMVEPGDAATWRYKRDTALSEPRNKMIRQTTQGIPYLAPAAVLLFKAKHLRDKDAVDFEVALPNLTRSDRNWLHMALTQLHPDHIWLAAL